MIYRNLKGSTRKIFSLGLSSLMTYLGSITQDGILQGQDHDQRTVRDLVQYSPRWYIPSGYTQLATHHEVHNLQGADVLVIEEDATYELDEGSIVVI